MIEFSPTHAATLVTAVEDEESLNSCKDDTSSESSDSDDSSNDSSTYVEVSFEVMFVLVKGGVTLNIIIM